MPHAYIPGLKVMARTMLRRHRLLPLEGKVLVEPGQLVQADTVVAEAELPGRVQPVNVAGVLGVRPQEVRDYMLRREGDPVTKDGLLAETQPLVRWFKATCPSPVDGIVESISEVTGQVMVREPPQKVQLPAYLAGRVVEVLPRQGAVIETTAAFVQGIFGIGGECSGRLKVLAPSPHDVVEPESLDSTCRNCIIVVGSLVSASLVEAARGLEAAAIVAGGMPAQQLSRILGYEIGVAVTGSERIGLSIVLTEGFGRLPMARRTFELLQSLDGLPASANGATQIRAGVLRPEIVVPLPGGGPAAAETAPSAQADGLLVGDQVRIIRQPHFGVLGEVAELVPDLTLIETEAKVRALRVKTESGDVVTVPRANVEIIQA